MSKDTATPMDPNAREGEAVPIVTRERKCWAMQRLINEVTGLFPETGYEVVKHNGRGVGIEVVFDVTAIDTDQRTLYMDLLRLVRDDTRVASVLEDEEQVLVKFWNSPRIYDDRDSFELDDAWMVLGGEES